MYIHTMECYLSLKKREENPAICNIMDVPVRHCVNWNKPVIGQTVHDPTYVIRMVVAGHWGPSGNGELLFNVKFQ